MDDKIVAISCLGPDFLQALPHAEDRQPKMPDAEVMTTALVARVFVGGNFAQARALRGASQYRPTRLSRRRFNRRGQLIQDLFVIRFRGLGEPWKARNVDAVCVLASVPGAMGDHDQIPRAQLYQQAVDRGDSASTKRSFDGIKSPLMVTAQGQPVACCLMPGAYRDGHALHAFQCDIPASSFRYADQASHEYAREDVMQASGTIA